MTEAPCVKVPASAVTIFSCRSILYLHIVQESRQFEYPPLQGRKWKLRAVIGLTQGHTATRREQPSSGPDLSKSRATFCVLRALFLAGLRFLSLRVSALFAAKVRSFSVFSFAAHTFPATAEKRVTRKQPNTIGRRASMAMLR